MKYFNFAIAIRLNNQSERVEQEKDEQARSQNLPIPPDELAKLPIEARTVNELIALVDRDNRVRTTQVYEDGVYKLVTAIEETKVDK